MPESHGPSSAASAPSSDAPRDVSPAGSRRGFVAGACAVAMTGGLAAAYGTFFGYAGRYLYPAKPAPRGWMFLAIASTMKIGDSLSYQTPGGKHVAVARQDDTGDVSDFIALSSTCPHLGCQVHWEGNHNRFFCPCHNGAFDPSGKAIAGPPAEAKQSLPRYPLKLEDGLLFINVETETLAAADDHAAASPTEGMA